MNGYAIALLLSNLPSEFLELSWTDSIRFSFSLSAIPQITHFRVSCATAVCCLQIIVYWLRGSLLLRWLMRHWVAFFLEVLAIARKIC
jgi:hypothetical protein